MLLIFLTLVSCCVNAESNATKLFNVGCNLQANADTRDRGVCNGTSLEKIASNIVEQQLTDVQINIKMPEIILHTNITFTNLTSLSINGESLVTTIICRADNSSDDPGIVLRNITDTVTLKNLNLTRCGSKISWRNKIYSSALSLIYCKNVDFNRIIILQSKGIGLMIVGHRGGNVSIDSSIFTENKLPQDYVKESPLLGGGGVYITITDRECHSICLPTTMRFVHCTFENNTSRSNRNKYLYTNSFGKTKEGYGRGGGVSLFINSSRIVHISFFDCKFKGNEAFIGGGLSVKILGCRSYKKADNKNNITVEIVDSLFNLNGCSDNKYTYFGGGARLTFQKGTFISDSLYLMRNVSLIENCAELGGGMYYSSDHSGQVYKESPRNAVLFDNCTFKWNRAHMGSAVDITPTAYPTVLSGYTVYPTFKNCYFLENEVTVNNTKNQKTSGFGTVRASQRNVHFEGQNCFKNNNGTAVYIINGIVNFRKSAATFVNNIALFGGALVLLGTSTIIVGPNHYEFIKNTATYGGGAIHVSLIDSFDLTVSKICFIQYVEEKGHNILSSKWNANITFSGNRILSGNVGHTIHATSLHYCQFFNEGTEHNPQNIIVNISEVFTKRGITIHNYKVHEIATSGAILNSTKDTPLTVIPGEKFKHGVEIPDDFGHKSAALFGITVKDVNNTPEGVKLDSSFSAFVGDTIQLTGEPKQSASLSLHTITTRGVYTVLNVTLLECPPGFKFCNNSKKCICNVHAYMGLFKCDSDIFRSYLLPGYWVGFIEVDNSEKPILVTSTCPFCEYQRNNISGTSDFEVVLPQNNSDLDRTICGETRTGIVCGNCRENYTVHFHSPGFLCKPAEPVGCKLGWLFYILSELVPVTVVFITVLLLNISFTSGAVNGFILFSQLLDTFDINASGIISFTNSFKHTINGFMQSYKSIYGFLNVDFFNSESLSFCLWKNASILDMIAFKYVTLLYILLLIVAVIWFMNKCGGKYCCGKYCRITTVRKSVIHGVSTFLMICYTKFVQVSIVILNPVHFNVDSNSDYSPPARVWMNGEILHFRKEHLPYALPAIFCLLTIGLFPPVLFLSYPLVNKVLAQFGCDDSRIANCLSCHFIFSRLKPLLDSFQSCFRDNMRFFAGLYFLYRSIILIVYVMTMDFGSFYTAVGCIFLAILALHMVCQPYIKREHNIIDTLLLINLGLINSLTLYNYHSNYYQRGVEHRSTIAPAIIQLILIYLPLVVMSVCVVIYLYKKVKKSGHLRSLIMLIVPRPAKKIRELVRNIGKQDKDTDSNEVELTHDQVSDEDVEYRCDYFGELDSAPFGTHK